MYVGEVNHDILSPLDKEYSRAAISAAINMWVLYFERALAVS